MRKDKHFVEALEKIKECLDKKSFKGVVYLFGSSIRDDYLATSDIDIAIYTPDKKIITILRTEFEDLNIPYKIDLIDLSEVSWDFRNQVINQGIILWKS
jgi:predicted nucleotidyltransferase